VGHPPNSEVIDDIIAVEINPTDGESPNNNENAMLSGINTKAIVNPDIISLIILVTSIYYYIIVYIIK
jgi:hypothetical protein